MDDIVKQLDAEHERLKTAENEARHAFAMARAKRQAIHKAIEALSSQQGSVNSLTRQEVREAVAAILGENGPQTREALKASVEAAFAKEKRKTAGLGLHLAAVLKDFPSDASGVFSVKE